MAGARITPPTNPRCSTTPNAAIVYNAQDAKVSELAAEAQTAEGCRKVGFTLEAPQAGQIGIEDGWIVDRSGVAGGAVGESGQTGRHHRFHASAEPDGSLYPHLVADALTALALVLGLGADRDTALKALTSFSRAAIASKPWLRPQSRADLFVLWTIPKPPTVMRHAPRCPASRPSL